MSEVKVRFHSINGYVALSMLVWIQCTWVDVDVRVKLLNSNVVAPCL